MHQSSYENMKCLVETYLPEKAELKVLDVGSYDINGSYKALFMKANWSYQGLDITPGPNVDTVLQSPYQFPLPDNSADVVVSGQAFEHIEFFWLTWFEMVRVIKSGGFIFLIVPSRGEEHRFPIDCWRFYPDSLRALAKLGSLKLLYLKTDWTPHKNPDSAQWGDTVGVFQKTDENLMLSFIDKAFQKFSINYYTLIYPAIKNLLEKGAKILRRVW